MNSLDFWQINSLTFEKPDMDTFKGLKFAYEAGKIGGTSPCVYNAANEVAVNAFLKGRIKFLDIYSIIDKVMNQRTTLYNPDLITLSAEDNAARLMAESIIKNLN